MAEAGTTVAGNLVADVALRYTAGGQAVANFTVCENRRKRNASGEWVDAEPLFLDVTAWGRLGEHVADSAARGSRVVVTGRLQPQTWEDKQGNKRRSLGLVADDVALSCLFAPVGAAAGVAAPAMSPTQVAALVGGTPVEA